MTDIQFQKETESAIKQRQHYLEERAYIRKIYELKAKGKNCQKCFDEGYAFKFANDYNAQEVAYPCSCGALQEQAAQAYREKVSDKPLNTFTEQLPHHRMMLQVAKRFISQRNQTWMYVGGAVGSGKTHLCESVVKELFEHLRLPTKTIKWREFTKKVKQDPSNDIPIMELISTPILYIDDFLKAGGDKVTEADINIAYDIIEGRLNKGSYTLFSSEYTIESLKQIDKSVASRIVSRTGEFIINISEGEGKDMRYR